jgi:hypothetical protein
VKRMKRIFILFVITVCCGISSYNAFSQEESLATLAKGQYYTIFGARSLDTGALVRTLDIGTISRSGISSASSLADSIDALYSQVSDTLDIHIYSYHGKLKFLANQSEVSSVFNGIFGHPFPERSFYLHERNTIYISADDTTMGMLGHEMAHAIISHYFVTPPPEKVQEVLAGYVEYHLRKAAGTLR